MSTKPRTPSTFWQPENQQDESTKPALPQPKTDLTSLPLIFRLVGNVEFITPPLPLPLPGYITSSSCARNRRSSPSNPSSSDERLKISDSKCVFTLVKLLSAEPSTQNFEEPWNEILGFDVRSSQANFDARVYGEWVREAEEEEVVVTEAGKGKEGEESCGTTKVYKFQKRKMHHMINGVLVDGEMKLILMEILEWAVVTDMLGGYNILGELGSEEKEKVEVIQKIDGLSALFEHVGIMGRVSREKARATW